MEESAKNSSNQVIKGNIMHVRFLLRRSRLNSLGLCPIECRITVNAVRATPFSTHIMVAPEKWESKVQNIIRDDAGNAALTDIKNRLFASFEEFKIAKRRPTPKQVIEHFSNTEPEDLKWSIQKLSEVHLNNLALRNRSKPTLSRYKMIAGYFIESSGVHYVEDVKRSHIMDFWNRQRGKGHSNDYCNKMIQALVGLFECAVNNEIIDTNPAKGHKLSWEKSIDLTCLDSDELEALKNTVFSDKLQRVADSFLFMCYTGLHITDYIKLTDDNIKSNLKFKWIEYDRKKTGKAAYIPLHPVVSAIIRKYGSITKLPRITGQKSNDYLKLIAAQIGTAKHLTNKVARKTFTDMSINQRGMSFESVAAMLGHASTNFVKVYGKVKHQRILTEWKA
jgi:site-specific recombinase XerD